MKNRLIIIYTFILLIIGTSTPAFAENSTAAYNSVINSYIDYYESNMTNMGSLPQDAYFYEISTPQGNAYAPLEYYGYELRDLNNDNIPELIVGVNLAKSFSVAMIASNDDSSIVEAIFTLVDGEPKLVCSSVNKDAYSPTSVVQSIFILQDNRIKIISGCSPYKENADHSYRTFLYNLNSDGSLNLNCTFIEDYSSDGKSYYYIVENGVERPVDTFEFSRLKGTDDLINYSDINLTSFGAHNPIEGTPINPVPQEPIAAPEGQTTIYRLHNQGTGEHLYTPDFNEYCTLIRGGWTGENAGWFAPNEGNGVYRLYSPLTNAHLYTTDPNEVSTLVASGVWTQDNNGQPLFYSGGSTVIYRLYNENLRMHLLTTDLNEYSVLGGQGWNQEGEKFNCI